MAHGSHGHPTRLPLPLVSRLPPISHLVGQDWSPPYQQQPSPLPDKFLDFRVHTSNSELMPSVEMQENRFGDGMSASTTNMGLPHNASLRLAGHDNSLAATPTSIPEARDTIRSNDTRPSITQQRQPAPQTQNMNSNSTHLDEERSTRSHNPEADASFLLKMLNLHDVEKLTGTPTLADLHNSPSSEPRIFDQIVTSLHELQLSDKIISLGAALIPRTCALRRSTPIFPPDSPWYFEAETAHATLVVVLRVAQLYLKEEPHDKRTFYLSWGFYPYDDLTRFARRLGDAMFRAPIEPPQLNEWCVLKRDYLRDLELRGGS